MLQLIYKIKYSSMMESKEIQCRVANNHFRVIYLMYDANAINPLTENVKEKNNSNAVARIFNVSQIFSSRR